MPRIADQWRDVSAHDRPAAHQQVRKGGLVAGNGLDNQLGFRRHDRLHRASCAQNGDSQLYRKRRQWPRSTTMTAMSSIFVPTESRRSALCALAIALFATALHLIFLFGAGDRTWPHSTYFEGDAPLFGEWAAALDQGQRFEEGLPLHSPVVPYLMHWLSPAGAPAAGAPTGRDFLRLKLIWCAISGVTCGLLFLTVAPQAGRRAAMLAALLCASYFGTYIRATSLTGEALYAALVVAVVGLTQGFRTHPSWTVALSLGALHGAATLLRAEHPLLALLLCGAMLWQPAAKPAQPAQNPRIR